MATYNVWKLSFEVGFSNKNTEEELNSLFILFLGNKNENHDIKQSRNKVATQFEYL